VLRLTKAEPRQAGCQETRLGQLTTSPAVHYSKVPDVAELQLRGMEENNDVCGYAVGLADIGAGFGCF
jgi:hypothetical protein